MWPFSRRSQASDGASPEALAILAKQIHGLGLKLNETVERLEALEAAHERLRGRFYAKAGSREPTGPMTKAEVLRDFGFVPGKPAPHT